jgi:hypothetical protein
MPPRSFRRRAAAVALPGIPLVLLIGSLISPTDSTDNAPQLRAAAVHAYRWDIAAFLELLTAALFPLAAAGIAHVVRARGSTLATVAAASAGLGSIGMAAIGFRHLFIYGLATQPQASALHVLDRVDNSVGPVVFLCMLAGPVALILLTGAAVRAGHAARWTIAGAVIFFVSDSLPIPAAEELQGVVGLVTFGAVAWRLLSSAPGERQSERAPAGAPATAV